MNVYTKKPIGSTIAKQNASWRRAVTAVVILILCVGVLNFFQAQVKEAFYAATSPLTKAFWRAGDATSATLDSFFNTGALRQEDGNLKEENQKLLSQIASLQETIRGDQAINTIVNNKQAAGFALTLAGIIGKDALSDTILINKGSADGISANMPVISDSNVLYGKVSKVYQHYSQVMLVSNKDSVVDIKIQPMPDGQLPQDSAAGAVSATDASALPPDILGVAKGSGNLSLYLDLISTDAKLSPQDTLTTSGQEGIFPKDLLIGKIQSSNANDIKPFQTAKVQPLFDIKNTENVFVITDYLK